MQPSDTTRTFSWGGPESPRGALAEDGSSHWTATENRPTLGRDGGSSTINKNIKPTDPEYQYAAAMRRACLTWGDTWAKLMTVTLQPGEQVKPHAHKRHAVLYYPRVSGPVIIHPMPGTMLYLPPLTIHEVPQVDSERLSVAMLVDDG